MKKGSFTHDVVTLVSGATFSQLLNIAVTPLLTRLYGPDAFGSMSLFLSIAGILTMIASMRYQLAIMLPEKDEEAASMLWVSLMLTGFTGIGSFIFFEIGGDFFLHILKAEQLKNYLYLVPVTVVFGGIFSALNNWNLRTRHFKRLSINRALTTLLISSLKVIFGCAGYVTGGGLIIANVVGNAIPTAGLFGQIAKDNGKFLFANLFARKMWLGMKRYRQFLLFDTWSTLLNNISWQLPAFLLSSFFSTTVVGHYSLGLNLLRMPMAFIGQAISQVFFQRAALAKTEGKLGYVVEAVFKRLVLFSLFPMLIMTVTGREIFIIVCGADWAEAGVFTQILSIWTFFWFISSPLSMLFAVLEKQKFNLKWNVFNISTRFLSLWVGGVLGDSRLALALFSISGVFVYGYLCYRIMMDSGVKIRNINQIIARNFLVFLPAGLLLLVLKFLAFSALVIFSVTCGIFLLYFIYIVYSDPQIHEFIRQLITKKTRVLKKEDV